MGRIIPWDLPKINGGSVGGYTPEPTPEPPAPEITGPYDFTNVNVSMAFAKTKLTKLYNYVSNVTAGGYVKFTIPELIQPSFTISGVKFNDTSNVGQVIAHCIIPKEQMQVNTSTSESVRSKLTFIDAPIDFDISGIMTTIGGAITLSTGYVNIATYDVAANTFALYIDILSETALELVSIDVYNVSGVVIQTWTPEEEEEEEE